MHSTSITRQLLYQRVWSEPMRQLAREFGISDVGLAKVCRKHKIPCPPRGYWAKKSAGQTPHQVPLPDPEADQTIEIHRSDAGSTLSKDLEEEVARLEGNRISIELRDHLRGAHPLIEQAREQFQIAERTSEGILVLPQDAALELRVSKGQLRRALLLMDAVLRALEHQNHQVLPGPTVTLLGISVRFEIVEEMETLREEEDDVADGESYHFRHSHFRAKRVPSGRLAFKIADAGRYWLQGCRQTWRDTPKRLLETCLEQVIAGLMIVAARIKQHEEETRRKEEAQREAVKRRQELAEQRALKRAAIQAERTRLDALLEEAKRWEQSRNLRKYIQAVREKVLLTGQDIQTDATLNDWIVWASTHADRLDPLTESPPSLLDEFVEEEAGHGRGYIPRW
ncbi:hypothetical protein [Planctomicrobium sp. SH527]|uniref:hypothetical protein n=1 Tax=Planctomicrobium sp. SH527 TaxID=3448123 RepID=UPI003F5BE9C0